MDSGWWIERNKVKDYKELDVWKKSMDLVIEVYNITKKFPKEEKYVLTDHIRKSCISIPSNISEGATRHSTKEFIQFLYIALGSASELETQLLIVKRLNYLDNNDKIFGKIISIRKMLNSLISSLKRKIS